MCKAVRSPLITHGYSGPGRNTGDHLEAVNHFRTCMRPASCGPWLSLPIFLLFFFFFWTFGSLIPTPWISIFSPLPTLLSSKRETSIRCIILPPLSCNFIISASDWMTRSMFLNLSPLSSRTVSSYKCWGIRTCIYPANLPLSVYCCILNKLFSRKYAVLSNPRRVNNIS